MSCVGGAILLLISYLRGRRQEAEGRRLGVLIKTKVAGYKAQFKKGIVSKPIARDTTRPQPKSQVLKRGFLLPAAS